VGVIIYQLVFGSGIGAAVAQHLARDGAKVIINYYTNAKAAEVNSL
jgi:NAD(P)-dependent dehydrogenase (short-subunit alcohol dehydrogenase family)